MSFKFEYVPTNMIAEVSSPMGGIPGAMGYIGYTRVFEDLNSYNTMNYSDQQEVACPTFQCFDPKQKYTVYRDNRALARSQNASWKDTETVATSPNGLPKASLTFRCSITDASRFPAYIKATWMVLVRG